MLGEKVGEGGEEIIDPGREKVQLQLARIGEEYKIGRNTRIIIYM